jgi:branched-chain amino acid transport system permease protein
LLQSALSNYTQAWLLYFGLFFLVIIMFSPGGIANLITLHKPVRQAGRFKRLVPAYSLSGGAGLVMLLGFFALIEMIYHFETREAANKAFSFFGVILDPSRAMYWVGTLVVLAAGIAMFYGATRVVRRAWGDIITELQVKGMV